MFTNRHDAQSSGLRLSRNQLSGRLEHLQQIIHRIVVLERAGLAVSQALAELSELLLRQVPHLVHLLPAQLELLGQPLVLLTVETPRIER